MKKLIYLLIAVCLSCGDSVNTKTRESSQSAKATTNKESREICWTGTISGKIPVWVHFQRDSDLIIGEITYLNTAKKLPIQLIGNIDSENKCRILEFDAAGNVTGIIDATVGPDQFTGTWYGVNSEKERPIVLQAKDTFITETNWQVQKADVAGSYHYEFGASGAMGDLQISRLNERQILFGITAVTDSPARNIAQIEDDTVLLHPTDFYYEVPDTDDCGIRVRLYRNFAVVQYTKGYCEGQFGMNASVEGIFIKTE